MRRITRGSRNARVLSRVTRFANAIVVLYPALPHAPTLPLLVLRTPAQEPRLQLLDAERHHDTDHAQHEERHHHVRGVERAERLDDEVTEATAGLAADELADDHPDQGERDGGRERREGPGKRRGND